MSLKQFKQQKARQQRQKRGLVGCLIRIEGREREKILNTFADEEEEQESQESFTYGVEVETKRLIVW